jgi:hypothetical protein
MRQIARKIPCQIFPKVTRNVMITPMQNRQVSQHPHIPTCIPGPRKGSGRREAPGLAWPRPPTVNVENRAKLFFLSQGELPVNQLPEPFRKGACGKLLDDKTQESRIARTSF